MSEQRQICSCGIPTAHVHPQPALVPIDWPARFRAAAEAARDAGRQIPAHALDDLAFWMETPHMSPDEVAAIGRALLGVES